MADYAMPLIGWFLYVGVPLIIWGGTAIWYWNRQRAPNPRSQASEGGESA